MEHAIRIIRSDNGQVTAEQLVTIKEMLSLGETAARASEYRCPDDNCARAMRPVLPKSIRADGKEVHSPHFRAAPLAHVDGCERDGAVKHILEQQGAPEQKNSPIFDTVLRTEFPVRFNDRKRVERSTDGGTLVAEAEPKSTKEGLSKPVNVDAEGGNLQSHTSESTSGHLRRFVESYENPPLPLSRMPIRIRNCPARTYAETFLDVSHTVDQRGWTAIRHIYRGPYREHFLHLTGIAIVFDALAGDGRKLGVWVKSELGPAAVRQELIHRLEQANTEGQATIYVIGRFQLWRGWKYTVEIEALGEVWVSLVSDQQCSSQQP